jgi:hypothetical protein
MRKILSLFKKKGELTGTIKIAHVPPFVGHSMSLSLFGVSGSGSPPPFDGVAPPEARQDEAELCAETPHWDREDTTGSLESSFRLRRPVGWYFLQLNVIVFRKVGGKMYSQVERFPFVKRGVGYQFAQECQQRSESVGSLGQHCPYCR